MYHECGLNKGVSGCSCYFLLSALLTLVTRYKLLVCSISRCSVTYEMRSRNSLTNSQPVCLSSFPALLLYKQAYYTGHKNYPYKGNSCTWKGTTLKFIPNYKEVENNFKCCLNSLKHKYI